MVSPISNVRFCANEAAVSSNGVLDRPGAYTKPATAEAPAANPPQNPPKKGSFLKKALIAGGVVVAVAAALVTGNKKGWFKILDEVGKNEASIIEKAGHYLGKAGEWIGKYTYEPIAKLFAKKAA